MDEDLIVVFGFVLVVLFAFVLPITFFAIHSENKKKMAELAAQGDHARAEALQAELALVNERLAVLERIVTDRRFDLDNEIRQLEST